MNGRQLGLVGLLGVGWFAVAVIALHWLDPVMTSVDNQVSNYLRGDYGWLMLTAFTAAGIGTVAIGLGLRQTLSGRAGTTAWLLFLLVGAGFVVAGNFKGDPPDWTGDMSSSALVHAVASLIVLGGAIIAAWFLWAATRRDAAWRPIAVPLGFAILMSIGFFVVRPQGEPLAGLTQRIYIAVMLSWLAFVAWRVRGLAAARDAVLVPAED